MEVRRLSNDVLEHHGIKGQSWGVRNGPPYPLELNKKVNYKKVNYKIKNIDKWGESPDNNILYITGYSGSGKSTVSENMADKNTQVIHLDSYIDTPNGPSNKSLDNYLKINNFNKTKMMDFKINKKERWEQIDTFAEKIIPEYAKEQYKKGNKVIVEGVQLIDETMYPDKSYFDGKPFMYLNTGILKSSVRAAKRDNTDTDMGIVFMAIKHKFFQKQQLKNVSKETLKNGKMYVDINKTVNVY